MRTPGNSAYAASVIPLSFLFRQHPVEIVDSGRPLQHGGEHLDFPGGEAESAGNALPHPIRRESGGLFRIFPAEKEKIRLPVPSLTASMDFLTRMEGTDGKAMPALYTRMAGAQP
jgi:hypothetical protein